MCCAGVAQPASQRTSRLTAQHAPAQPQGDHAAANVKVLVDLGFNICYLLCRCGPTCQQAQQQAHGAARPCSAPGCTRCCRALSHMYVPFSCCIGVAKPSRQRNISLMAQRSAAQPQGAHAAAKCATTCCVSVHVFPLLCRYGPTCQPAQQQAYGAARPCSAPGCTRCCRALSHMYVPFSCCIGVAQPARQRSSSLLARRPPAKS
jgi:hypothetical protein